jgi:hypothetical protein
LKALSAKLEIFICLRAQVDAVIEERFALATVFTIEIVIAGPDCRKS